jgi:transposase
LKSKRNQQEFEAKRQQLSQLEALQEQGFLQLYYYDESGFSLTSALPYAWQKKGKTIEIPAAKGKRINVAGLIDRQGDFHYQTHTAQMGSKEIIGLLDSFCQKLRQKTVVVVDNAPTHRSRAFMEKVKHWQEQDLFIFFLPAYSPELNKIEMLWRKIKYCWLDFNAYLSWNLFSEELEQVLSKIGSQYIINFV